MIEPRRPQHGVREIEPGEIEAGKALAGEVERRAAGGAQRRFEVGPRHLRLRHVGRGQIEPAHDVLRRRRGGRGEDEGQEKPTHGARA